MKKLNKNKKGFSLVELLIAVAVVGIVCVPLLRSFVIATKMSVKASDLSKATIAAKNIMDTIDARPVSNFMNLNETDGMSEATKHLLSEMMSKTENDVSFANVAYEGDRLVNDSGEFKVVMQGVQSGTSSYDAVVTFTRGNQVEDNFEKHPSHGLYLINENEIAQYDKMDAIFSQPYSIEANPDTRADEELRARAASKYKIDLNTEPTSKKRKLDIFVFSDDDNTISSYVRFLYTYKYEDNQVVKTAYTYSILPGKYNNNGKQLSLYIMYYPWFGNASDNTDEITIFNNVAKPNNSLDETNEERDELEDRSTRDSIVGKDIIDVKIYLYTQTKTLQNGSQVDISLTNYHPDLLYRVPMSFNIAKQNEEDEFQAQTFIYTNAFPSEERISYDITNGYNDGHTPGAREGWYSDYGDTVTGDLVRKDSNKLIYNIRIDLYKPGDVSVNNESHMLSIAKVNEVTVSPIYTLVGSKS